jgi:hypothetical protein
MSEAEKLSKEEALKELSETQPLRGKYADAFRRAEDEIESKDDAIIYRGEYNDQPITETEVAGMRSFFNRHAEGKYRIRSKKAAENPERYTVVIHLAE